MLNKVINELISLNSKPNNDLVSFKSRNKKRFLRLKDSFFNSHKQDLKEMSVQEYEQGKILNTLVSYMAMEFMQPEEQIIKEDQEPDKFYFVIQGDCLLNMYDQNHEYH